MNMMMTHKPGLCLDCNYPLRDLPQPRCPECGREFDPADPATMNMGRSIGPWAYWALGPVRWPVYAIVVAAVIYTAWAARLPVGQTRVIRNSLLIWPIVGAIWLLWPGVRWYIAKRN